MTQPDDQTQRAERIAASVRETLETDEGTRRRFLTRSVGAGGALLALGGGTGIALAQDDDQEEGDASEEPEQAFADVEGTDVDVLNYLIQGESPAVYGGRESDTSRHKPCSSLSLGYPL